MRRAFLLPNSVELFATTAMTIHPTAIVDPSAVVHDSARIGPFVLIGAETEIGENCEVMAGAVIHSRVRMGKGNRIHSHAVIGDEPQYLGFDRQIRSGVRIGDNNEIRELVTIHRGLHEGSDTAIGSDNLFMATSHIAHDCLIGNNVIIANNALLAGHVTVEDRAFVSGAAAIHQFCRIGKLAMVGGLSGISKDVPPFTTTRGDIAFLVGLNVIGLRRGGIGPESRMALKRAFRELFRSGHPLTVALSNVRASFGSDAIPDEVEYLLRFCESRSKRGILAGRSLDHTLPGEDAVEDAE